MLPIISCRPLDASQRVNVASVSLLSATYLYDSFRIDLEVAFFR